MNVTRLARAALVGASLTALATGASLAATAPAATAPAKHTVVHHRAYAPAPAMAGVVDPAAVAALGRMSAYLRTNPTLQVTSTMQRDEVDNFGQLLTFDGETIYKVKTPNAFTIEVSDRDKTREYVYDGRSVTVFDPKTSYYTRFDAPPTIRATLDAAQAKYGVEVPLEDLFHWDEGDQLSSKLTSAHFVGNAKVNGQDTAQYAFRQPGVDWQIWITTGDKPTPVRVVVIASDDPARPQFEANLTWDMAPQFAADTFVFTPPPGAKPIPIVAKIR
jgi:hypothetical protein